MRDCAEDREMMSKLWIFLQVMGAAELRRTGDPVEDDST
jgi:hypothetical protein